MQTAAVLPIATSARTLGYSQRMLAGFLDALAPLRAVFADTSINEIMINGPHDVFIRQGGAGKKLDTRLTELQIRTAIQLLASMSDKVVDRQRLLLSARLPGLRIEAALPPLSVRGPSMCVRRHAATIMSMQDYIACGTITQQQAEIVRSTIEQRKNFLIAGGTFSGKTTLMNMFLSLIDASHRLFVIEQVQELKIALANHVLIECDPEQGVTARRAVMLGMRYSPDRIFLGELRGGEAYDFLDASNTGHPGSGATIHADGAEDALRRLESLVMMAATGMPFEVVQSRIASSIDVIFFIEHRDGARRLSQICQVNGFDPVQGKYFVTNTTPGEPS